MIWNGLSNDIWKWLMLPKHSDIKYISLSVNSFSRAVRQIWGCQRNRIWTIFWAKLYWREKQKRCKVSSQAYRDLPFLWDSSLDARLTSSSVCLSLSVEEKRTAVMSLRFVDPDLESRYSAEKERRTGVAFTCCCVVLVFTSAMEMLIDPQWVKLMNTVWWLKCSDWLM